MNYENDEHEEIRFEENDYVVLTELLVAEYSQAIEAFAATKDNHDIYAVGIFYEPHQCEPWLCINDEASAAAHEQSYVERGYDYRTGSQSMRYSVCDFVHRDISKPSPLAAQAINIFRKTGDMFTDDYYC
jgi:hypothetical protein